MTLDFRSEVEMWLFCACTMKKICNITAIIGTVQSLWSFVDLAMGQIPCLTECIYNKKDQIIFSRDWSQFVQEMPYLAMLKNAEKICRSRS